MSADTPRNEMFRFDHDRRVKPGCCNYSTATTFWMAASREAAEEEIRDESRDDAVEPSGLCARCMAEMLAESGHEIIPVEVGE